VQQLHQSADEDFVTLTFKDGRVFERVSFPLMRRGEVAGRVLSFRDVTERKRAEEEKKKLEEQLRHSQKMEAIGTLAGGIAHDFNNILGAIIGYTELASDDLPDFSITKKNLFQVLAAANRAKDMVKQILAFSRKDKEERNPILLSKIIDEAFKLLRSSLPTTIDIRSNISSRLSPVLASQTQINQVIMNLCTNAAHAMREKGGILEIALREIDLDPDILDVKDLAPGRYQQLSISDTGHGITPGIKDRIFEPYFTTKKTGEGTGMGLAMVYGIVKGHSGEITVYSEPGKGTTVHVYLAVLEKSEVTEGEIDHTEPVIGGSERILFVDDEVHLAEVGKQMLEKLGYRVTSRTSSTEALEDFRGNPSHYDLVITDQTMPGITGVQLAEELKQIKPGIPVILSTGFSEKISESNYKSRGIDAFVMKPTMKKEIARVIRRVLA
jgi:signal transduction histidine kinase/CheY-like chemotaxis protein